jgi:transposase
VELTAEQWALIEPLFPEKETIREGVRGRPYRDPLDVFDGFLWILRTGAPWREVPSRYPPYQTCHRRFKAGSR